MRPARQRSAECALRAQVAAGRAWARTPARPGSRLGLPRVSFPVILRLAPEKPVSVHAYKEDTQSGAASEDCDLRSQLCIENGLLLQRAAANDGRAQ